MDVRTLDFPTRPTDRTASTVVSTSTSKLFHVTNVTRGRNDNKTTHRITVSDVLCLDASDGVPCGRLLDDVQRVVRLWDDNGRPDFSYWL